MDTGIVSVMHLPIGMLPALLKMRKVRFARRRIRMRVNRIPIRIVGSRRRLLIISVARLLRLITETMTIQAITETGIRGIPAREQKRPPHRQSRVFPITRAVNIRRPKTEIIPCRRVVRGIRSVSHRTSISANIPHMNIHHHRAVRPLSVGVDIRILPIEATKGLGIATGLVRGVHRRIRTAQITARRVKGVTGIPMRRSSHRRHRHSPRRLPVMPRLGQGAPPMFPRPRRIKYRVRVDIVIGRVGRQTHGIKIALARDVVKPIRTVATPRQRVKAVNGIRRPRR